MVAPLIIGPGITLEGGISMGSSVVTITSADISNPQLRYGGYSSYSSSGFTSDGTNLQNGLLYYITDNLYNAIYTAQVNAGFDPFNAWVWSAAFTTGGTVLVRMGLIADVPNYIIIVPIDQTDTRWQTGSDLGPSLTGTFTFPATLTPYYPSSAVNGNNNWC